MTDRLQTTELHYLPSWALAHQASTAELRHMLGAPVEEWEVEGGYGTQRPDAIWHRDGGPVFVEHDAGYPGSVVAAKLRSFSSQGEVVWGTPSSPRRARLQARYGAQARFVQVDITGSVRRQ